MTIRYGQVRLTGLSGDTKPLNVPEFSRFTETDTLDVYLLKAGVWTIIPNTCVATINDNGLPAFGNPSGYSTAVPETLVLDSLNCVVTSPNNICYARFRAKVNVSNSGSTMTYNVQFLRDDVVISETGERDGSDGNGVQNFTHTFEDQDRPATTEYKMQIVFAGVNNNNWLQKPDDSPGENAIGFSVNLT